MMAVFCYVLVYYRIYQNEHKYRYILYNIHTYDKQCRVASFYQFRTLGRMRRSKIKSIYSDRLNLISAESCQREEGGEVSDIIFSLSQEKIKHSERILEMKLPCPLILTDRPTDYSTSIQTDVRVHKEVSLPINRKRIKCSDC